MITKEAVLDALHVVMHPEVERNLVELGMIGDLAVDEGNVSLKLMLPFKDAPVKDELVKRVKRAIADLSPEAEIQVGLSEMSQQERAAFHTATSGGSKPAQAVNDIRNVIAVLSGKGGVGKSSVTALLAVALKRRGARVGVLDADITGPSIPMMFNLHKPPQQGSVGILPPETATGIKVMSINLLLPDEEEAVVWRGPLISRAITQFWEEVMWGQLDYLVVDLPPGTSDAALTVMQSIPLSGVVLVTSPQDLAGMIVRKAARMAQKMNAPILGVVENMSYIQCPKCGETIEVFGPSQVSQSTAQLGLPLLGRMPLDPALARHCDAGEIEEYDTDLFTPIVEEVVALVPSVKAGGA
jgi:Mrp family chromosome partitioning ATPase